MKSVVPKSLLFAQTLFWIVLFQTYALGGPSEPTDALTALGTRRALFSHPCNPVPHIKAFQGCMDNLGNCDADVLVPTP